MAGTPTVGDVQRWAAELDRVAGRIGPRFARAEVRGRAVEFLRGLVSAVERKNGWQLAESVGELSPKNVQHFIGRAKWSGDEVRDDLRNYIIEHIGDDQAVLIVDETGFFKKGMKSAGVSRQYSGTAGRIENCQIGVFLAYRSDKGHALIDRALYLPKCWTDDRDRCREAGIPTEIEFATKPELARRMLKSAFQAGVPACLASTHYTFDVRPCDAHSASSRRQCQTAQKKHARLIPLTVPEVRRLLIRIVIPPLVDAQAALAYSIWRRRRQAAAKQCHYHSRGSPYRENVHVRL